MVFYGGAIGWTSYWDGNLGRAYPVVNMGSASWSVGALEEALSRPN
jgi:hypothetical protein